MKTKLKEITDSTVSELLGNEIILPSNYFQCFDKHAKTVDINLENETFEKELSELILDEFNSINSYVTDAITKIDDAAELTADAQQAIKDQNTLLLKNLYQQIGQLKNELQSITDNVYKDYLTKVYNKKWIYHKYLNKDTKFKNNAIIILIDVADYEYIAETYNQLISNNLLIYIASYLKTKLKEENLKFNIARYLKNRFVITLEEDDLPQVETLMSTISSVLYGTTLKSNSGVMIKPTFDYAALKVKKEESFHETLDLLLKNIEATRKK